MSPSHSISVLTHCTLFSALSLSSVVVTADMNNSDNDGLNAILTTGPDYELSDVRSIKMDSFQVILRVCLADGGVVCLYTQQSSFGRTFWMGILVYEYIQYALIKWQTECIYMYK